MQQNTNRRIKVIASGVLATGIDLVVLVALVELAALPVALGAFLAAAAGAAGSFLVNKYWAFGDGSPLRFSQAALFASVALGSAVGVGMSVHVLSVWLGLNYLFAKGVGAILTFLFWSYPMQSRVVFSPAHTI